MQFMPFWLGVQVPQPLGLKYLILRRDLVIAPTAGGDTLTMTRDCDTMAKTVSGSAPQRHLGARVAQSGALE